MAAPSYTYSLTNGSTADASQVTQNFNDILNGVTDGTKDLTISALTANGTANLKGQVNLGDATADDIQFNGSLATTLPIKTDNTYDIGTSSKGLRALYFGANSQRVNFTGSATMSATWTLTLPVTAGSANQLFGQTSAGTGIAEWKTITTDGTGTDVGVTHTANTVTLNLPSASATARGLMTTGTQTVAGTKTFSGQLIGKGTATNDAAAAGYMGEYFENVRSTASPNVTSGQYFSVDSGNSTYNDGSETGIVLTAGDWDISGTIVFSGASSAVITDAIAGIGTAKGNSSTGVVAYSNMSEFNYTSTASGTVTVVTPIWRVSLSGNTTYYLKGSVGFAPGTCSARGTIRARRVR